MEDRNAFFVGKCLFTTGLHNTETFLIFCFNHFLTGSKTFGNVFTNKMCL